MLAGRKVRVWKRIGKEVDFSEFIKIKFIRKFFYFSNLYELSRFVNKPLSLLFQTTVIVKL